MSFGDHLDELRRRLIIALLAPAVLLVPCLIFGKQLLNLLTAPVYEALLASGLPPRLQALSPPETFVAYFKVAIIVALIFSAPVILWQAWLFVSPGLYRHEKRFAYILLPGSLLLTVLSVVFLYFVVLPLSLRMLILFGQGMGPDLATPPSAQVEGAEPSPALPVVPMMEAPPADMRPGEYFFDSRLHMIRIMGADGRLWSVDARLDVGLSQEFQLKAYLNLVFLFAAAFSLAFQFPLAILLAGWIGIIDPADLRRHRRYVIFGIVVLAAVLTPPDVVSQIAMAIPLYILFELSIWLLIWLPASRVAGPRERMTDE